MHTIYIARFSLANLTHLYYTYQYISSNNLEFKDCYNMYKTVKQNINLQQTKFKLNVPYFNEHSWKNWIASNLKN